MAGQLVSAVNDALQLSVKVDQRIISLSNESPGNGEVSLGLLLCGICTCTFRVRICKACGQEKLLFKEELCKEHRCFHDAFCIMKEWCPAGIYLYKFLARL